VKTVCIVQKVVLLLEVKAVHFQIVRLL